jgi:hypothetical protein
MLHVSVLCLRMLHLLHVFSVIARIVLAQEMRKTVRLIRRQLEAGGCSATKSAQLEALEALFLFVGIQVHRCQQQSRIGTRGGALE